MIDDYFIYPNAHDAKNALCVLDMKSAQLNKNALDKYHFDIVEPFSGNVSYEIIHINYFENHINRLVDFSHFLELEIMKNKRI